jgi:hypothetical protein
MNPGAIEEVSKVATGTIDALKNQPLMIALIVLQAFVLGAVLYNSINRQEAITKQFDHVYELLETCMKGNFSSQKDNS